MLLTTLSQLRSKKHRAIYLTFPSPPGHYNDIALFIRHYKDTTQELITPKAQALQIASFILDYKYTELSTKACENHRQWLVSFDYEF